MSIYKLDFPKLELRAVKKLHPRGRQVLVIPIPAPEIQETSGKHGSSIFVVTGDEGAVTNFDRFPIKYGLVVAVGPDVDPTIQPDDVVYFHKMSGQDGDMLEGSFLQIDSDNIWGHADVEFTQIEKQENGDDV